MARIATVMTGRSTALNATKGMYTCFGETFSSYCSLLSFYEKWQWEAFVIPFKSSIDPLLPSFRARFTRVHSTFLGSAPRFPESRSDPLFFSQSEKKDAHRTARRFALGVQPRGTSLNLDMTDIRFTMRNPMLGHVRNALNAKHPALLVEELLENTWKFVFDNVETSLKEHGSAKSWENLNRHRVVMQDLFKKLASELEPLRQNLMNDMPQSCKLISRHIHVPFFYVILVLTNYPNPDLAFRLLLGSPILGKFDSPALVPREKKDLPLTDENMRYIALRCAKSCRNVLPSKTLTPQGKRLTMEKIEKELAKSSLAGPFANHEELCVAIEAEIRKHDGLEHFVLDRSLVIVGPTFTVEELHAWQQADHKDPSSGDKLPDPSVIPEPKLRNIWNGVLPNKLTESAATYMPNNHSDVSVIVLRWITLLVTLGSAFNFLAFTSDFTGAYRQMPLCVMHLIAGASCHWNYRTDRREYVFYRSLPFGSSLAPAGWSEVVFALCHILAISMFIILTHCVDDVCSMEVQETIVMARNCFLDLCRMIGFVIDMDKSPAPCERLIYLGLQMVTPARIPRADYRYFSLSITDMRRCKLITGLERFLGLGCMTPGEASSYRGKLMFYTFWHQAARSFMSEFAARQYSESTNFDLTPELAEAVMFFIKLLNDQTFLRGIRPELIQERLMSVIYTDGALEGNKVFKGVGGVLFQLPHRTPLYFSGIIDPNSCNFDHIAPIEMHAVYRALVEFGPLIRNRAVIFFVDNTHALGCLLKRSATVRERDCGSKRNSQGTVIGNRHAPYTHFDDFCRLSVGIRRTMNEQAKVVWELIHELQVLVWFEYVKSAANIADPPSRGKPLPMHAIHISQSHRLFTNSPFQ